ncbi:MAG: hypothetical protein HC890_04135 [Chloroflexaceae bacterium]|nr:hypothetical protein [Chloroflexaceae bacterium]
MELPILQARVAAIKSRRDILVSLLEQPNLGNLRLDVDQALEELDELLEAFEQTFPEILG